MAIRKPGVKNALSGVTGPVMVKNAINSNSELRMKLVTTAQGATNNLLLFQGPTPKWLASKFGCTVPDQNNVTLSSSLSAGDTNGLADLNKYLEQLGMYITSIRFISTDTTLYNNSLYIGEMPPNGIASPEEIHLSAYASVIGGGGYDKTLTIADRAFSNTRNFFMYLSSVPASASIDIIFTVAALGNTFAAEQVG